MQAGFSLQSELRTVLRISSGSLHRNLLYRPLWRVCSPGHKGRADLTSSPPSSPFCGAVSPEKFNWQQGLRPLWDLTRHLTARADDSHAAPVKAPDLTGRSPFGSLLPTCQVLVRFFVLDRIKPHAPLLVRAPVNSFEF